MATRSMAAIKAPRSKDTTSKRKLIRQKQCRRKASLMKKACEDSRICSADICVGIRIRETGQVHT
ncbi:Transcription factor, MADS-box [Penicillium camemberti]|uniref:Transcription factor, MADS-box n=1 Tax=Penicillium camemberti (strain FM 013) TaxID=1429867 RepID=A0A0G4PJQ4_PENC3|nr:Transcription factor, MADS-box [Penicillium camemberti]